jgi:GAF domain-containing protein
MWRLLEGASYVHIHDLAEIDEPTAKAVVELAGIRTTLFLALRRDTAFLGMITAARDRLQPFAEKEIALLQNFAAQAVIAMENARLLGQLRQRTDDLTESLEYQTATSDVLKTISRSTSDVQPVLDTVVKTATRLCCADVAGITIREGEVYRYVAGNQAMVADAELWAIHRQRSIVPGRDSMAARVLLEGRVVHVADISADPD